MVNIAVCPWKISIHRKNQKNRRVKKRIPHTFENQTWQAAELAGVSVTEEVMELSVSWSTDLRVGIRCLISICRSDWHSSRSVNTWARKIAFSCSSIVARRAICWPNSIIHNNVSLKRSCFLCAVLYIFTYSNSISQWSD